MLDFLHWTPALMPTSFATAFGSHVELTPKLNYLEKASRNYEFIRSLIKAALGRGELSSEFASEELTMGLLGIVNIYVMGFLVNSSLKLDSHTAERIVHLFLRGAGKHER